VPGSVRKGWRNLRDLRSWIVYCSLQTIGRGFEERSESEAEKFWVKEFKLRRQRADARELADIRTECVVRDYNGHSAGVWAELN